MRLKTGIRSISADHQLKIATKFIVRKNSEYLLNRKPKTVVKRDPWLPPPP
jgi:hypothetical protein